MNLPSQFGARETQVSTKLLSVEGLRTYFFTRKGVAKAVDDVTFSLERGESLCLVGESGSGKSMTCLSILRLVPEPGARIVAGRILLDNEDLLQKSESEMRKIRGKRIGLIPQDPMTSLNPGFTIWSHLSDTLKLHQRLRGRELWNRARDLLKLVRIPSPEDRLRSYPHQMSGGMRQRVVGALALSSEPDLLIADEPTSALDVTIQAQYLDLLRDMRSRLGVSLIFVTHDFGIAEHMSDRVAVMYAGKIVEEAPTREIFDNPHSPYTVALMKSVPRIGQRIERLVSIGGEPPALYDLPDGCAFYQRCAVATSRCEATTPPITEIRDGHRVRCWKYV